MGGGRGTRTCSHMRSNCEYLDGSTRYSAPSHRLITQSSTSTTTHDHLAGHRQHKSSPIHYNHDASPTNHCFHHDALPTYIYYDIYVFSTHTTTTTTISTTTTNPLQTYYYYYYCHIHHYVHDHDHNHIHDHIQGHDAKKRLQHTGHTRATNP